MTKRFVLDVDSAMGMVQFIEPDEDGVTIITETRNLSQVLGSNHEMRRENNSITRGDQTWGHLVASIPVGIWELFCRENPELRQFTRDAQVWLLARLNDPEYRNLKVYDGGVGLVRQV